LRTFWFFVMLNHGNIDFCRLIFRREGGGEVLSALPIKVAPNGSVPLAMFGWTALVVVYFLCWLAFS